MAPPCGHGRPVDQPPRRARVEQHVQKLDAVHDTRDARTGCLPPASARLTFRAYSYYSRTGGNDDDFGRNMPYMCMYMHMYVATYMCMYMIVLRAYMVY